MDTLPLEIITDIFLHMDLRQKIQCMLVSPHWANIIKSSGLLETVDICNLHALKSFIRHLRYTQTQGHQVKHLTICNDYFDYFRSSQLCSLFPNLKTIYLKQAPMRDGYYKLDQAEPVNGSNSLPHQMTDIIDYGDCDFTRHLLSSGQCCQLTTLTLDLEDSHKITTEIIRLLKNSPNLLKLTMHNPILTLHDLECLLNYLSRLQSLTMRYVQIRSNKSNNLFPIVITPSPSVKALSLSVVDMDSSLEYLLLAYIKRKLNCLEDLALWNSGGVKFKRSTPHTTRLWIQDGLWVERNEDENEDIGDDDETMIEISSWIPFVQYYGYRLKSIGLESLEYQPDLITVMDEAGCRLQKLSIYDARRTPLFDLLSQSKQCTHIQELELLDVDTNLSLESLQQMSSLTKLAMTFTNRGYFTTILFNHLLNVCCDRLTSLVLTNVILKFDTDAEQQYGLKKLELNSFNLPDGFGLFLSRHFQNLRHLTLNGRIPLQMSLHLPQLHLSCINIKTPTSEGNVYFSVVSLADNTSRSYALCHHDNNYDYLDSLTETYGTSVCTKMPPTCLELSNHERSFVLVCASVQNVILNNLLAC